MGVSSSSASPASSLTTLTAAGGFAASWRRSHQQAGSNRTRGPHTLTALEACFSRSFRRFLSSLWQERDQLDSGEKELLALAARQLARHSTLVPDLATDPCPRSPAPASCSLSSHQPPGSLHRAPNPPRLLPPCLPPSLELSNPNLTSC